MSKAAPKPTPLKPFTAYLSVRADGTVAPERFFIRKNPIAPYHLWEGERSAKVWIVELPEPKPRKPRAKKAFSKMDVVI